MHIWTSNDMYQGQNTVLSKAVLPLCIYAVFYINFTHFIALRVFYKDSSVDRKQLSRTEDITCL